MDAKEYLYRVKNMDDYINAKIQEAAQLRSRIRSLGAMNYDGLKVKNGSKHDFTDAVDSLLKLEGEINEQIDRLADFKREAEEMIDMLKDNRYKTILLRYYLCNERFDRIAERTGYSVRQVQRLHGLALIDFKRIFEKCHEMSLNVM